MAVLAAMLTAVAADRPIILHPKCEALPFDFLGPSVEQTLEALLPAPTEHR